MMTTLFSHAFCVLVSACICCSRLNLRKKSSLMIHVLRMVGKGKYGLMDSNEWDIQIRA